jgi:hypothetical protein
VFQFLLVMAMRESGKAKLLNTLQIDGRIHYTYVSAAGDVYSVARPEFGTELEKEMREALEGILDEEGLE